VQNQPTITTSTNSVTGLFNFYDIGQSVEKTIVISGSDLKDGIVLTPSYNFEISKTSGYGFTKSSITLPLTGTNTVAPTTIYIRLYPYTYPSYDYNGSLKMTSTGATVKTVTLTGRSSYKPIITTSKTTITGLNYFTGSGPSAQQSFTVSMSNITDPLVVTAPANFELSTTGGTGFVGQSSLTLNGSYNYLGTTTIYVRLKSGLSASTYNGNIGCASTNAVSKTISLTGTVASQPVVSVSTTSLNGFSYNIGNGPSSEKMFTVSGSSLNSIIFIYAPTNYELSTSAGSAFSATSSIILPQSGGNVAQTTIYVRLKAGLTEGNYTESVTITSAGVANQLVSLAGTVVNPNGLTVSETAFSGMDYLAGNGPSAEKSFTVSGSSINSIVIITAPDNYEISTYTGNNFQSSQQLILQPVNKVIYTKLIFVRLKSGLSAGTYSGSISVSTAGYPTKSVSLTGNVSNPIVLLKDQAYYEPRNSGTLAFSNNWLYSRNIGNYYNSTDLLGTLGSVRSMSVSNGKMLFCSRSNGNQLISIDSKTGVRNVINLATNVFTYTVRNFNNTADSLISVSYPCNDIKVDNGGNVLISNTITNSAGRFQIWKINPVTGSGTVLIDQSNFAMLYPNSYIRIESFNVLGDVNTIANIYAVCSSLTNVREIYRWSVNSGVAKLYPELIKMDAAPETVFGTTACVYPIDGENFYIDGDKILPFKYNINTGFSDSFKYYPDVYTDSVTSPMYKSKLSSAINGVTEFKVNGERFLLVGASYYTTSSSPSSTFRIYKYPSYSDKIADLQCLWSFPMYGMGTSSSPNRMVSSAVEVDGKTATIYVYYPENGYGVYEMKVGVGTDTESTFTSQNVELTVSGNEIVTSEFVQKIDVYTVAGQLLKSAVNTKSVQKPASTGVYIVKTMNNGGNVQSQKIIIQ